MAVCEKCWSDAVLRSASTREPVYECYLELLDERREAPCSSAAQRAALVPVTPGEHVAMAPPPKEDPER